MSKQDEQSTWECEFLNGNSAADLSRLIQRGGEGPWRFELDDLELWWSKLQERPKPFIVPWGDDFDA